MPVAAFILLIVQVGREYDVAREIEAIARELGVEAEVYVVYGEYDIVVKAKAPDLRKVDELVTRIRKLPGVTRSVTLISSA